VTAGVLLGLLAYGLLQFNSKGVVETKLTQLWFKAWKQCKELGRGQRGHSQDMDWVQEHILRRAEPGESAFVIKPYRLKMIFLYGLPV